MDTLSELAFLPDYLRRIAEVEIIPGIREEKMKGKELGLSESASLGQGSMEKNCFTAGADDKYDGSGGVRR